MKGMKFDLLSFRLVEMFWERFVYFPLKFFFYLFVFLSCADYSSPYNWHFFHCAGMSLLLAVVQFHSCCCLSAVC